MAKKAKRANPMSELTEFYSKVCVARSIKFVTNEASKEEINLSESDQFSHNLATILARNNEVVAVNLKILPNKCRIYISKNNKWLNKDTKYIEEIQVLMKNLSKDDPITFEQAAERKDVFALFYNVLEYCSVKLGRRLNKLKKDIKNNKHQPHIKSFLEFLESSEINVNNLDEINESSGKEISKFEYLMTTACCEYYKYNKKNKNYPQRFLGHIKKVGSYAASVMDIVNCACKDKYKIPFSCIDLRLLDPVPKIRDRLNEIYGGTGGQLDRGRINHIYLHVELNILTNTDILSKEHNEFIAVSKKCCYLCESYIKFLRSKGYKITVSGGHKKLYHKWKLPDTYSSEFAKCALCDLDQIIESEIEQHTKIIAKSDSNGENADSDNPIRNHVAMKKVTEGAFQIKTNSNL
ncbi:hypothetical protein GLOIN_2v1762039 [Rhizophagus irregularis DAOM 181602=DAOM 197198]|uniref:Uncharacterized protein n=2 Tax=Rhizophagus irregularis TaxID=588596 RepID=A0A015LHT7_RHIIW|nr:hypothetical protein GLOIN_2v1762039 [Rhizophagus irregularis DAOM 181602=DAOM 197198]EXX72171.1 hypothetical protein RirG_071820 [Rhizophagus irregularis DAOM 197198w]POG82646.1 hypothetical protein GLOIN_2v1762039 [Rhizophagus irregularis DAOM 181602=DAOM 197198]|eukprot:XP_025189512.1 hypothetical protein GLOIN_2v1762039 [Rhizophagus irregularis DAOM 181602=DAOM 197198]